MKISIIQPDIIWEDKLQNFNKLESLISKLFLKTDLVVLPEMFNTGFSMNVKNLGELPGAETYQWMKSAALKGNFGLCGSYIVNENDHSYNRFVFVSPEKDTFHYDKRHLFSMGAEDRYFSPGSSRLTFTFRGVRISPYICYDLRFPVWSRNRNDCDLIIYSANWPEVRIEVWNTLLKARAIENQCYVAGSNRVGTDGTGLKYSGESALIGPKGEIIVSAGHSEGSVTGEISMNDLLDFRKKFPVFNDADDFSISNR